MGSEKRQRQRENRMRAIAEAERAKKRSTTGRKVFRVVLAVAAVLIALWLWSTFSGGDDGGSDDATVATSGGDDGGSDDATVATEVPPVTAFETDEPSDETLPNTETEADDDPDEPSDETLPNTETEADDDPVDDAAPDPTACPAADGSDGPLNQFDERPPICIDPDTLYAAAFETSMGDFTMVLDPRLDLDSVNNFVVLSRWRAFEGTLFHRVISNFVIQGGDVELKFGTGGPGYRFTGGFPEEQWYRVGSVAMANNANPASNGSQFFVITGADGASLPPNYSPLGHVVEGLDTVLEIDAAPTETRQVPFTDPATGEEILRPAQDVPVEDVVVHSVTITEATEAEIAAYTDAYR